MDNYIDQQLVRELTPDPKRDTYVRDSRVTGFQLKLTPAGKVVYRFTYRSPTDSRQRTITLGAEPSISADSARAAAITCGAAVKEGRDPAPEQRQVKRIPTFAEAWAEFVEAHQADPNAEQEASPAERPGRKRRTSKRTTWRPATATEYGRIFRVYVDGKLKARRVDEIKFHELDAMVQRIARESGPVMAHNVKKRLATFFTWCGVGERYLSPNHNPTLGIKTDEPEAQHFVFEKDELARLGETLKEMAPKEWTANILVLRFLLLSGVRKQEALQLRWDEVDMPRKRIVLAPERHKTGGQGDERVILLTGDTIAVLEAAKAFGTAIAGGQLPPYVFPSQRDWSKPIVGLQKIWDRVRTKAGITARIHDLRHNVGGIGGQAVNQVQVRDMLGHKKLHTTDRYMKAQQDAQRAANETVSRLIAEGLEAPTNVVAFGGKK